MGDKCTACGKSVFAMEKVSACGKSYHQNCLRCATCKKVLRNGNWEDKGGTVYCTPCYSSQFVDDDTKNIIWEMENAHAKVRSRQLSYHQLKLCLIITHFFLSTPRCLRVGPEPFQVWQ